MRASKVACVLRPRDAIAHERHEMTAERRIPATNGEWRVASG